MERENNKLEEVDELQQHRHQHQEEYIGGGDVGGGDSESSKNVLEDQKSSGGSYGEHLEFEGSLLLDSDDGVNNLLQHDEECDEEEEVSYVSVVLHAKLT